MSSDTRYQEQIVTKNILLMVTNVCSECYNSISEGDTIFYDSNECRYICSMCHCKFSSKDNTIYDEILDSTQLF